MLPSSRRQLTVMVNSNFASSSIRQPNIAWPRPSTGPQVFTGLDLSTVRHHLFRLGRLRRWSVYNYHACFPAIALTNKNSSPVSLDLHRATAILALNSHTPFSKRPCLIASRTYNMRRILIRRGNMVAEMKLFEPVSKRFLDGRPAVMRP